MTFLIPVLGYESGHIIFGLSGSLEVCLIRAYCGALLMTTVMTHNDNPPFE